MTKKKKPTRAPRGAYDTAARRAVLGYLAKNPGRNAVEVHHAVCVLVARGRMADAFDDRATRATIRRAIQAGLVERGAPTSGVGVGLFLTSKGVRFWAAATKGGAA